MLAPHHSIFRSLLGDVLKTYYWPVHTQKVFPISLQFGVWVDLDQMCTSVTSTRLKVDVTGLLKFRKLQFSRSSSSAILA